MLEESMTEKAIQWLNTQMPQMERLLRDLVECSSCTTDPAGVNAAGEILRAATPGDCEVIPSQEFGSHFVFHGKKRAIDQGVILVGHIDTVFPKSEFQGYRSSGNIARGPGVLDMKGGLVMVTFALKALAQAGVLEKIPYSFAVVSDEEAASPDSINHLQRVSKGAKCALVFEAGRAGDAIITRRKGGRLLKVRAIGRAAHSGNAHASGANAIWAIGQFIDRLQRMTDYSRGITVNVGTMRGGVADNVVPARAEADVDTRFLTQADFSDLELRIFAAAKEEYIPGTRIEVEWGPGRLPMERTAATQSLFESYSESQKASGLGSLEHPLVGGGSDGCTTAALGIPTIDGLGPRGTGYHTHEELIELDSLVPKTQSLVRYLTREFCS
jgi:glutamate carboxypeptidase